MSIFLIIINNHILQLARKKDQVISNLLFFFIFISIYLILSANLPAREGYLIIFIWLSLLSSLIFVDFLKDDFRDGSIEQMITNLPSLEIYIAAKIIGNWLIYCLPKLIILSLLNFIKISDFLIISLATLSISFICSFAASFSSSGNSSLVAIIALPLTIPILLLASGNFPSRLPIIIALLIFLAPILTFASAKIVKIISD